ncbi:g8697 [Coccomyxa viridis]|uniref:G8697 protein n=1 Tax=Coccomyxa viridis TaxID=1274662 RepID=A0ABP1G112_9CHLO
MPRSPLLQAERDPQKAAAMPLPPYEGDAEACPSNCTHAASFGANVGYRKEFGFLSSFCSSFALMSYVTGITGTFALGYNVGGPVMVWSNWILTATMNLAVAMCLAEISSAMPVAGGPYYWCLELTDHKPEFAILGWINGWLNVLGQFATTAFAADILASHIASMFLLGDGHVFTSMEMLLAYAVILLAAASLSSVSTRGLKVILLTSGAFLFMAGVGVSITLLVVAPTLQPTSWAVRQYDANDMGETGLPNLPYMFLIGCLMGQATFIGYEAPAQFAEETRNAARNVPWAIVLSVVATAFCGGLHLAALLFSVQDVASWEADSENNFYVAQVYHDVFKARFGSATGGIILLVIPAVAMLNCMVVSLSTNARVLRAMAQARGVPLSRVFQALSVVTKTPINAVWAMAALAFLLGLPLLYSSTVFSAIASISSLGLYVSYGVPILLRICKGQAFEHGPFSLGRWYLPIGITALAWVVVSTVAFMLPTAYPIDFANFNYAPISVAVAVAIICLAWYLPRYGARGAFLEGSRSLYATPSAMVLLGDRTNRFSMESVKSVDYKKQEQLLESAAAAAAAKKLTLLDLIEDQGAKAGAPAPGMHLTRQRAAHEQFQKKIAATRASLDANRIAAAMATGQNATALEETGGKAPLRTRAGRPPSGPTLQKVCPERGSHEQG